MNSGPESTSKPAADNVRFAPMPLRARGGIEIFDVSVKAFKQYAPVLLAWSAMSAVFALYRPLSYFAFFTIPLVLGACVCCLTAAVRGQLISFSQCWRFTKPRYWRIVGTGIVGPIVAGLAMFALILALALLTAALVALSSVVGSWFSFVAFLVDFLVAGAAMPIVVVWIGMARIVVCMERDRGVFASFDRTWSLMSGHMKKVWTLSTLMGLGFMVLLCIGWAVATFVFHLEAVPRISSGLLTDAGQEELNHYLQTYAAIMALIGLVINPLYYLVLGMLYLDLRVRKEALDIEWNAHVTGQTGQAALAGQAGQIAQNGAGPNDGAPFSATGAPALSPLSQPPFSGDPSVGVSGVGMPEAMPIATAAMAAVAASAVPVDSGTESMPAAAPLAESAAPPPAVIETPPVAEPLVSEAPPTPAAPATTTCTQCGSPSPAGQSFCMNCGARLA